MISWRPALRQFSFSLSFIIMRCTDTYFAG
jgi:hypothetical protein